MTQSGSVGSSRGREAGGGGTGVVAGASGEVVSGRGLRSVIGVSVEGSMIRVASVQQGDGGRLSVTAMGFAGDDVAGVRGYVERANADGIAVVLGAGSCVVKMVRSAARPTGNAEQVAAALGLMAEAEAPGQAPAHRRACAALQVGKASGLVAIGWTKAESQGEGRAHSLASLLGKRSGKVKGAYVPPLMALVGLARGLRLDESRPGVIAAVQGRAGASSSTIDAIAVGTGVGGSGAGAEAEGVLAARSTMASDQAGVRRTLEQMAVSAGVQPLQELTEESAGVRVFVSAGQAASVGTGVMSGVVMRGGGGGGASPQTIGECGLAIGAAIVLMQQRPTELPALAMSLLEPGNRGPWWERMLTWPGTPLRLGIACGVGLAIIIGAQLGSSMLQARFLRQQLGLSGEGAGDDRATQRALAQSDWFRLQREYRVPVASILAELAGTAPAGVTIENLAIDQSFPNTGRVITVTLSGTSPSAETVNQWRSELLKRGTFSEVPGPTVDESVQPARYTLTPRLSDVMKLAAAKVKPLPPLAPARTVPAGEQAAERPAGSTRVSGGVNEPPPATPAATATTPARPPGTGGTAAAASPLEIPPALTDAQIAAMNRGQVIVQWGRRRGFAQNPTIEPEIKARLEEEVRKLDARRAEFAAQSGAGGAGAGGAGAGGAGSGAGGTTGGQP